MRYFKLMDEKEGQPRTLFHGVNGSRQVPLDTWLDADVKQVRDGGSSTPYDSGFHLLVNIGDAINYALKFRDPKLIVEVEVDEEAGIWEKAHSPAEVLLARRIRISQQAWDNRLRSEQFISPVLG